jgi:hypothetical protein
MSTAWLPNGALPDGTLLFGPLREPPKQLGPVEEVSVNGVTYYVAHSGKVLTEDQKRELQKWVEKMVSSRAPR